MKFDLRPPHIAFHDSKPGNHATMFVDGVKIPFRGDLSHFDNRRRQYMWVFEGAARDGSKVVFATEDREVAGSVRGSTIVLGISDAQVTRSDVGKPQQAVAVSPQKEPLRPTRLESRR